MFFCYFPSDFHISSCFFVIRLSANLKLLAVLSPLFCLFDCPKISGKILSTLHLCEVGTPFQSHCSHRLDFPAAHRECGCAPVRQTHQDLPKFSIVYKGLLSLNWSRAAVIHPEAECRRHQTMGTADKNKQKKQTFFTFFLMVIFLHTHGSNTLDL